MIPGGIQSPIWAIVLGCGLFCQVFKTLLYSIPKRRIQLFMLFQSSGLPSLASCVATCLLTLVIGRCGWSSPEAGFALAFAVIGFHDALKLGGAAVEQQRALFLVLDRIEISGSMARRAMDYLDPRHHHPAHLVAGAVLGGLFGLAFGLGPG
ncbi:divergent PAP2 family protein [bacterium]|nr:divergent PAP2 family protein [bacterium]PIV81392.1 MAG: hypothetical protein COW53_04620 [bacterium CG17_big_fil_post_rev_8_21_14_2_50_64_8]PJA75583.1 MAG: hypothetical protein CO151_05145 [bacterium CG_4_9_14_3_um_filter_65_15]